MPTFQTHTIAPEYRSADPTDARDTYKSNPPRRQRYKVGRPPRRHRGPTARCHCRILTGGWPGSTHSGSSPARLPTRTTCRGILEKDRVGGAVSVLRWANTDTTPCMNAGNSPGLYRRLCTSQATPWRGPFRFGGATPLTPLVPLDPCFVLGLDRRRDPGKTLLFRGPWPCGQASFLAQIPAVCRWYSQCNAGQVLVLQLDLTM